MNSRPPIKDAARAVFIGKRVRRILKSAEHGAIPGQSKCTIS